MNSISKCLRIPLKFVSLLGTGAQIGIRNGLFFHVWKERWTDNQLQESKDSARSL